MKKTPSNIISALNLDLPIGAELICNSDLKGGVEQNKGYNKK